MDFILYFIRDSLSGTVYFIYTFILLMCIFAIIGYMLKQKYGKLEIKLATSQSAGANQENGEVQETNIQEGQTNNIENNNENTIIKENVNNEVSFSKVNTESKQNINSDVVVDAKQDVTMQNNLNGTSFENIDNKDEVNKVKDEPNQYVSLFENYEPTKKVNPTPLPNPTPSVENNPQTMPNTKEEEVPKPTNELNEKFNESIPELKL